MSDLDILYNIIDLPSTPEATLLYTPIEMSQPVMCETLEPVMATPVKRKPAWTSLEQTILIETVNKLEGKLFGKFKGPGRGKKEREVAWETVARAVNEVGVYLRTGKEAAKQYANLKNRAKEKVSNMKRPQTGGGPKPASPTPIEEAIIETMEGRPSLEGLSEGFDSGDLEVECGKTTGGASQQAFSDPQQSYMYYTSSKVSSAPPRKEKSLIQMQKEILRVEKRKLEMELEVLLEKKEKIKEEREVLRLQKGKLVSEC